MRPAGSSQYMVGREPELAQLRSLFVEAAGGSPRVVVVSGEAGIGKSRLLTEFTDALDGTALVLVGQCIDFGGVGMPYAPLAAVLRELVTVYGVDTVLDAAGNGRKTLLGLVRGVREGTDRDDRIGVDRLNEVITILLEHFSAERPLVVVIEDLHWADPATLDFLRFGARVMTRGAVLFALSYRSDDVGRGHRLRTFLAELERLRHVRRMQISRLDQTESLQLVRALGDGRSPRELSTLARRSEGVPFFLEELLRLDGDAAGTVPGSIREVLTARYESLGSDAQLLVRILAAGGGRVDDQVLADVAQQSTEALEPAAREAVDAGVLVVDGHGYRFRHALVRDAVHDELLPSERSRFHTRYAEAISRGSADPTQRAGRAALIAFHWMEAHALDRAFTASLEAMELSWKAFAYASAAELGERALSVWDQVPSAVAESGLSQVELLDRTALAWRNAGETHRALAMIDQALDLVEQGGPRPQAADRNGARRGRATTARLLRDKGSILKGLGSAETTSVLEQAMDHLPPGVDPELRADVLSELAASYMVTGDAARAVTTATEVIDTAPADATASRSVAANIRGITRIHGGDIEAGLEDLGLAKKLARNSSGPLLRYFVNASDAYQLLGRFEESLAIASEGLDLARAAGVERSSGAILTLNTVDPLFAMGRWQRADEVLESSLELDPLLVFRVYLRRAKVRSVLWRGDPDRAWALYESWSAEMTRLAESDEQVRAGVAKDIAEVAEARGDLATAWRIASVLFEPGWLSSAAWRLEVAGTAARILARRRREAGDGGDSPLFRDDEARIREIVAEDVAWPTRELWSRIVDAQLSGPSGSGEDPDAWQRAAEAAIRGPASILTRMLVQLGLGRAQLRSGERDAAAGTLHRLRSEADRVGAGLVVQEVDRLVGPPENRRMQGAAVELTAREQQVLELIAEGLSNGAIANRLYISTKTVSVHVSAILRKLGASSRTDAVRRSRSRGA